MGLSLKKISFCCIGESIQTNPGLNCTEAQIEREIMLWLRKAADREGGRQRRRERKLQESLANNVELSEILHN